MTDSRLEKMGKFNRMKPDINESYLRQCEGAGLVVIDPDAIDTQSLADVAYNAYCNGLRGPTASTVWHDMAVAIVAALRVGAL